MKKDSPINQTAYYLQTTMLDILERRAIIEGMEDMGMRSMSGNVEDFIRNDYLRVQLEDLRKFFDRDGNVYSVKELIQISTKPVFSRGHKKLFEKWKEHFEGLANKLYLHLDRSPKTYNGTVTHESLNSFIDEIERFLRQLIADLKKTRRLRHNILQEMDGAFKHTGEDAALLVKALADEWWPRELKKKLGIDAQVTIEPLRKR